MRPILKNKYYLYLTEFFAGMAVMAVELGASRLLAPYFSSSQIVWTIIIGTIMIAMALGNIYGGRSADRDPNPDRLYRRILIAAVWIALIPVLGKYVILGISGVMIFSVNANYLIWAAFAACMVVFVFPLFLLGTVTPSLAKYTMENLEDNARIIGRLGAANTIGSIIGTFVPTFVSIPAVGTAITFLIFSGILLLLALVYFFSARVKTASCIAACVLFLLSCFLGWHSDFAFWKNNLLYEGESIYNYLQVEETDDSVILSTNVLFGVQSVMKKDRGLTGMYYDYAMAAPFMAGIEEKSLPGNGTASDSQNSAAADAQLGEIAPESTDAEENDFQILVLGMGTGTYASQCARYYPGIRVEGVEIDDKITQLAHRYFELPEDLPVSTYDGRAWMNAVDSHYDVIMVDAYQDITIPFQMSSVEFFTLVREHLKDNGVMVVNMNMRSNAEGNINQYLADTIASVFPAVMTVDVPNNTNRELFASRTADMKEVLLRNSSLCGDPELRSLLERIAGSMIPYTGGERIMTDDKAPVELLGMRVIDDLIRDELSWYRTIYEEEGLSGILEDIL